MPQYSWPDRPAPVRAQVERILRELQAHLADQLIGVYLHGSLAMGCFNPGRSDLDLLVVTREHMPAQAKRAIVELLLDASQAPAPIEISFLRRADLHPWRHPAPFDLHYSEGWRERYVRDLTSGAWQTWDDGQGHDPDLACHVLVTRRRGVCLYGEAIGAVLPEVPPQDYVDSIRADVEQALESIAENPVYAVLNACRTSAYLREGQILSKEEGGVWALRSLSSEHRGVVATALALYRGEQGEFVPAELDAFAASLRGELSQL